MTATFTNPLMEQIVVHNGDDDIKAMVVESGFTFPPRPAPGKDTAFTTVRDKKSNHVWLVFRFYYSTDDGYLAFGLPASTPNERIKEVFRFLIEATPSQGDLEFKELDALSNN